MRTSACLLAVLAPLVLALAAPAAEVRGVLAKVDPDRKEVVLEGRGRGARGLTFTFTVDADTRILLGQEPGRLGDLVPGKRAHVIFEMHGDRRVALVIQAHGIAAPAVAAPPAAPATADPNAITGTLRRVAYTEREIVVIGPGPKGPETETTLAVPADVKVTRDGKAVRFDDLQEGEKVAVTPEKRDGKLTAAAIQVGAAAPATPATPPKGGTRLQRILGIAGKLMQMAQEMRQQP
ncbi:MAG TPA: hypothetical protein VJ739_08790 [Gemmataceae bacterium]|nr:hypothetical protein [Gemmataceae bacterium]